MTFKGCVMVKKTRLLDLLDKERSIFSSNITKNSKWFSFGRTTTLKEVLEEDLKAPGLREYAEYRWYDPCKHFGVFWSLASQQLRKTSVLRGESAEPHDNGEADTPIPASSGREKRGKEK